MEIDGAMMARYAEYCSDGSLALTGAGTQGFYTQPLQPPQQQPNGQVAVGMPVFVFIGIRLAFERPELSNAHTMQVVVAGPNGAPVFDSGAFPLALQDQPGIPPGAPLSLQIPFGCPFAPAAFGFHTARIALDGAVRKQLSFFVAPPPQMQPHGG